MLPSRYFFQVLCKEQINLFYIVVQHFLYFFSHRSELELELELEPEPPPLSRLRLHNGEHRDDKCMAMPDPYLNILGPDFERFKFFIRVPMQFNSADLT